MSTCPRQLRVRSGSGRIRIATLTAVSALALTACGSASAATPSGATTQISLWESHNGGPVGAAMSALVNRFNATHHSVHVSIVVTKASKKLLAAAAAGDPPVLAEISHYDGQLVKGHALVSWNSFMRGNAVVSRGNLLPVVWDNGLVGAQHYRLQTDMKLSEVFYNASLFTKAGITTPPATWTALASDAAKLRALGVIPVGWKDSSAHILPAFMSNGGSLLQGSNSVGTSADFAGPAGQATFSYFRSLYAAGDLQIHHGTTLREDLAAGKMAMIDGTSAGYQKVLDAVGGRFPVGAFVEPAGSTGTAANISQGLGFVLPKGHSHRQDAAAWSFVQWWFGAPQQAYWAEHTGYAPETRAGVAAIPSSFLSTHPGLQASLSAATATTTVARPVSDRYKEVQSALDAAFFDAVTGKESVTAALSGLDARANSYLRGASKL